MATVARAVVDVLRLMRTFEWGRSISPRTSRICRGGIEVGIESANRDAIMERRRAPALEQELGLLLQHRHEAWTLYRRRGAGRAVGRRHGLSGLVLRAALQPLSIAATGSSTRRSRSARQCDLVESWTPSGPYRLAIVFATWMPSCCSSMPTYFPRASSRRVIGTRTSSCRHQARRRQRGRRRRRSLIRAKSRTASGGSGHIRPPRGSERARRGRTRAQPSHRVRVGSSAVSAGTSTRGTGQGTRAGAGPRLDRARETTT